jgi:hypothetical protein
MATYTTGTTFTFAGTGYTVTSITYSMTDVNAGDTIDVSHLGLSTGSATQQMDRPLKGSGTDTGREVQIEYLGNTPITDGSSGALAISGAMTLGAAATVTQSSVTLAVNDVCKGSATFKVAR